MKLFGLDIGWGRKAQTITLDQLIQRLESANSTLSGISVTPETAMESPTVQAVVRAIAGRISTLPVHVMQKTTTNRRTTKEPLPSHPVARLLNRPNERQTSVEYWLDATSWLIRHGNYYAFKGRGQTGPIRRLDPLPPSSVSVEQRENLSLIYHVQLANGARRDLESAQVHHVRGAARNGFLGDSPINDARESIALEIAVERFGATFFGNGAMPGLVFKYATASQGHKDKEGRQEFIDDLQAAYGNRGRFRGILLPKGIELEDPIALDNDKAQFLQTRKHQQLVIAGALGVPPHLVGNLEKATFNNMEQQSLEFIQMVVLPCARTFETAMERDLLTDEDRARGVILRFNLDAALRADFQSRQEGLKIQREMGILNPNEWRELEGMNPRDDEGGEAYWDQGPSGQGATGGQDAGNGNQPPATRKRPALVRE